MTSGIGLEIVIWVQGHGGAFCDSLARLLHFLGSNTFYVVALATVYAGVNRRLGLKLLFALLAGALINALLKELFQSPRPCHVAPDRVIPLVIQTGYGFPSGHVMSVVVVWGTVARTVRRGWVYGLVAALVVAMAWARVYLGVHYLHDVIGGAVLGGVVLYGIDPVFDWVTRRPYPSNSL